MRVYFSSNCLPKKGFAKTLRLYARAGLKQIELSSYADQKISPKIEKLIAPGDYLVHNYFPPPKKPFIFNLASLNPEIATSSLSLGLRAISLCQEIGSPIYSFHGGFLYDPEIKIDRRGVFRQSNEKIYDKNLSLKTFLANVIKLKKAAGKAGIKLLVENNVCPPGLENKLLFCQAQDFSWFFSQPQTGNIGMLLDTGHLKVSASTLGFSPLRMVNRLSNKIMACHLHDNNGRADSHQKVNPESWIEEVIDKLKVCLYLILEARLDTIDQILNQKTLLEQFQNSS